jgi:cytochrome P450
MQLDTTVYRTCVANFQRGKQGEVFVNEHVQTATNEPLFNPLSPAFIRDPYPSYERLRVTDPVHLTEHGSFLASRHAEVSLVLRDKRFGKDFVERTVRRYGPRSWKSRSSAA